MENVRPGGHSDTIKPVPDRGEDLVARFLAGDERAFARLYDRFARYVAGVAFRILGRDEGIDDIVQETFLEVHGGLARLEDPTRVKAFLATIAVRRTYRRLDRITRWQRTREAAAEAAGRISDPADRELMVQVYQALDDLPPKLRVPWILHRLEGETIEDTAALCGASESTIKRRIRKAAAQLERRLGHG